MAVSKPKAFVIGVDGASFNILDGMISQGIMPNLKLCKDKGSFGNLCIDTNDRGWATLFTGKDASAHKGFYWIPNRDSYSLSDRFSYHDYDKFTIWRKIEKKGCKTGIVGLPTTFPAPEIEGFVVANGGGGLNPQLDESVTPTSLLELSSKFSSYMMDVRYDAYSNGTPKKFFDDLIDTVSHRVELTLDLIEKKPVDLAIIAFEGPDRMLHWFYDDVLNVANGHNKESYLSNLIVQYYKELDKAIGSIVGKFGDAGTIYIVSDHGFIRHDYDVYINMILSEIGLAKPSKSIKKKIKEMAMNYLVDKLPAGWRVRIKKSLLKVKKVQKESFTSPSLDWDKTVAFGHSGRGVYINKKGLYPSGIVTIDNYEKVLNETMSKMSTYKNPITGDLLFSNIRKRDDVYKGDEIELAPDIIFDLPEGYDISRRINYNDKTTVRLRPKSPTLDSQMPKIRTGIHSGCAVYVACGKGIDDLGKIKDRPMREFYTELTECLDAN